jgi:hypothetical protein
VHLGGSGVWGFELGFGTGFYTGLCTGRSFRAGRVRVDESHLDTFFSGLSSRCGDILLV